MTRRSRFPWWLLALVFIGAPMVEIYVLVQVGQVIGVWQTIGLLILSGVVGAWLMKREGSRAWRALRSTLQRGQMPARELADGMLILIGGTLMLAPGFLSDLVGMALILPFTRPIGRRLLTGLLTRKLGTNLGGRAHYTGSSDGAPHTAQRPGEHDVVPGEVVD